jgi:hypothetical protein
MFPGRSEIGLVDRVSKLVTDASKRADRTDTDSKALTDRPSTIGKWSKEDDERLLWSLAK